MTTTTSYPAIAVNVMVSGFVGISFVKSHNGKRTNNLTRIAAWCAKLYQHDNYKGWVEVVPVTPFKKISSDLNNQVSSIQVNSGCILKAYQDYGGNLMATVTSDVSGLETDYNDQLSGYDCQCDGKCFLNIFLN